MTPALFRLAGRLADPDAVLLTRFRQAADQPAFAELVRRHGPLVWGVCRRRLPHPDAEDAFQAAFLVLARRTDPAPRCLPAFLHRVAVLTCRNVARSNRRRKSAPLPADVPASTPDPSAKLDVDTLLDRLSPADRRAVVLCHLLGHTRTEAATALGIPEGTLSARLSRGLARLRGGTGLAVAVVPAGLARAVVGQVRSPAAEAVATGVLRMFWLKKLTAAVTVVAAGATMLGVASAVPRPAPAGDAGGPVEAGRPARPPAPDAWRRMAAGPGGAAIEVRRGHGQPAQRPRHQPGHRRRVEHLRDVVRRLGRGDGRERPDG
jgi:RNA polymerase sigma factor (sigma-70 family)